MPNFKMTMVFLSGGVGWSETFYKADAGDPFAIANAVVGQNGLLDARRAMMSVFYAIKAIKVANVDAQRDGIVSGISQTAGQGTFGGNTAAGSPAVGADDAVNFRLYSGTTLWRSYLTRGLPQTAYTTAGTLVRDGAFGTACNALGQAIVRGNWSLRQATTGAAVNLTAVTTNNQQIYRLTSDAPIPGLTVASTISVKGAFGISNVNGRYRVIRILDANVVEVVRRIRPSFGTLTANTGRIAAINYTYPLINRFSIVAAANRQTGRPLDASRGRAPVRRS